MRPTTALALLFWLAVACTASNPAAVTIDRQANWDMKVVVRDAEALYKVGLDVANANQWPEWKPGTPFRAIREQMLKQ